VEKPVHRIGKTVSDAGDRAEQVGAWAQVGNLAQEFQRMRLGLDWVGLGVLDPAEHLDPTGAQFEVLALPLRGHKFAVRDQAAARGQVPDLALVVRKIGRGDHLDGVEAATVA
jgi:hypothetical protein